MRAGPQYYCELPFADWFIRVSQLACYLLMGD